MNHCGMTHSVVLTLLPRRRRGKYNSSHTSSKYETLNRSYFPLTTNKNTEDEQQKYPFAIWVLQDWEGTSGIAHVNGNSLILSGCQSDFCSTAC